MNLSSAACRAGVHFFLVLSPGMDYNEGCDGPSSKTGAREVRTMYGTGILYGIERRRWRSQAVRTARLRIHRPGTRGRLRLLFKLCLAAALTAEAAWLCGQAVSARRFMQIEERQAPAAEQGSAGSGIRLRLDDGEISLFKVEEYSLPAGTTLY